MVAVPHLGRVAVHMAEERLVAAVDHLHRLAGVQGQKAQVDLQRQVLAGAERPAHPGQGEAHLLLVDPQARRDLLSVDVQPLGGYEQLHAAVVIGQGQARLGAHEGLILHAHLVGALHHHLAGCVLVAVADVDLPKDVAAGVDGGRGGRGLGIGQRFGDFVVHHDGLGGPAGDVGDGRRPPPPPARPHSEPARRPAPAGRGARARS